MKPNRSSGDPSLTTSISSVEKELRRLTWTSKVWTYMDAIGAPARRASDDSTLLKGKALYIAVCSLNAVNAVAFFDIQGIGVAQSTIVDHYNGDNAIDWVTVSALIGATVGQCILGYLSDLFSRRKMLLTAITLLMVGALGCVGSSYIHNAGCLNLSRAICGIATGSISNLVNISQNDIATVNKRLQLQGIQGFSVAAGSIAGSIAAALLPHWRHLYVTEVGLAALVWVLVWKTVPPNRDVPTRAELSGELKKIDFLGIGTGVAWVVPGLLLLNKWLEFSTLTIAIFASITGLSFVLFILFGLRKSHVPDDKVYPVGIQRLCWRRSRPIAPFRLFRNLSVAIIMFQNVLFGAAFYSFIYFSPILAQVVRAESAWTGVWKLIPYFAVHGLWSAVSAQLILFLRKKNLPSFSAVMAFGFACWALAMGLLGWDCTQRYSSLFVIFGILVGLGTGSVFQNSVLVITNEVVKEDKAVALGTRNVLRFLGGAIGTAMSSMIMRTVVRQQLPDYLDPVAESAVADHAWIQDYDVDDRALIRAANAEGIETVWYVFAGFLALCAALCCFIRNESQKKTQDEEKPPLDDDLNTTFSASSTPPPEYTSRRGSHASSQPAASKQKFTTPTWELVNGYNGSSEK